MEITAIDLRVGDVLPDWWGTNDRSCSARVTRVEIVEGLGPFGKTHEAVRFWCEPLDPTVPDNPRVAPDGECEVRLDSTLDRL